MIPGTVCHYVITGKWDHTATMQACISGGNFNDGSTCTPSGKIINSLLVIWNTNGSGTLNVSSSNGNASLTVTATQVLSGGSIVTGEKTQTYSRNVHQYYFHCSNPSGGSCKPSYSYQWQQSIDMLQWTDITGATKSNLTYNDSIQFNTYFRRKVTDKNSSSVAYSDIAGLSIIIPVMPGDSLFNAVINTIQPFKEYSKNVVENSECFKNEYVHSELVFIRKSRIKIFNINIL